MKVMNLSAEDVIKEKLGLLPVVKKIEFSARDRDSLSAELVTKRKIPVRFIMLDPAFPGIVERRIKEEKNAKNDDNMFIVAPYISQLSADICKRNNVGYFDYSGNCFVSLDDIYISDTGHENIFPKKDIVQNIFKSSSNVTSKILRELFRDISKTWKLKYLADKVGCSIGMVARVKDYLCGQSWAVMDSSGLKIINPEGILNAWSHEYVIPKDRVINAYTMSAVPEFEALSSKIIEENCYEGCLTAFAGGARYAPVVRYTKVHLWIKKEHVSQFVKKSGLKLVDSGANVTIFVADDDECFHDRRKINESIVASPLQTYLDLMLQKGRGEEMADAILRREIINGKR